MERRWVRSLVILAALVLVTSGCTATQRLATNSPESSPSSDASPSSTAESPTPSSAPIVTVTPSTPPASPKPAVLTITSASFHAGEVGIAYAPVTLHASGGVPPYSWAISVGALPGGLQAAAGGSVSGTPTGAGTFAFTVHVADTAGGSAIVNRSITVARHLTVKGICTTATPCAVEAGCVTVCGRFASQGGGVAPFKYVLIGSVPPGMGLSQLALTGPFPAPIPGISLPPPYRFQVTVTDALGASGSVLAQFSTFNHITLQSVSATEVAGSALNVSMAYAYGSGAPTAKVIKGSLPPGSKYYVDTAKRVIVIQVPAELTTRVPITYVATFQLTDQSLCGPSAGQLCYATASASITIP